MGKIALAYLDDNMHTLKGPTLLDADGRVILIQEYYVDEECWVEARCYKLPNGEC